MYGFPNYRRFSPPSSGHDRIFSYFGDIIPPEFPITDAIAAGALVPYDYYPIPLELTPTEREKYLRLTQQVARCVQYYSGEIDARGSWVDRFNSPELRSLLIQRARLIGCAEQKIPALKQLMKNRLDTSPKLGEVARE
jgi:superfamily II DNA or RNA helicase